MINPATGLAYTQAPAVVEEIIPSEGSFIHRDGRLYDAAQVSPGSKISLQSAYLGQNIATRRGGLDRPLGSHIQNSDGSYTEYVQEVDPTAGLSSKDVKIIEKHLPEVNEDTTVEQQNIVYSQEQQMYAQEQQLYAQEQQQQLYNQQQQQLLLSQQPQVLANQSYIAGPANQSYIAGPGMESIVSTVPVVNNIAINNVGLASVSNLQRASLNDVNSARSQSHQTFMNWEVARNSFMTDRLNIIDDLLAGMERKVLWVETGMQKTIQWFHERHHQESEFAKKPRHNFVQLGEHFESMNQPANMFDFSKGLKESDNFAAMETRNSEIMALYIKKDIIDWVLIPSDKLYKNTAQTLRAPLYTYRKKLDSLSKKRGRAYKKYFKSYDKLQMNSHLPKYEDKLYRRQMKYALASREEIKFLRAYCQQALVVIGEFTALASARVTEIQRAFTMYLAKYTELHQNTVTPPQPIAEMIDSANSLDSMRIMFSAPSLMNASNYEFMRNAVQKDEVNYGDIENYLVLFPDTSDPARNSFIVREWNAIREGNYYRKPRPCTVVATNTNALLLIDQATEEQYMGRQNLGKVNNPMQLKYTRVEGISPIQDGLGTIVDIVERAPGTFFHHTHKNRIRFESQEEAASFLSFVNNQTAQINAEIVPMLSQQTLLAGGSIIPNGTEVIGASYVTNTVVSAPVVTSTVIAGQPIASNQIAPMTYQTTGLINSQLSPIPAVNAQSIVTPRAYSPNNQSAMEFTTPVRGQQYLGAGLNQSGVAQVQTMQVPINQAAQMTGDL